MRRILIAAALCLPVAATVAQAPEKDDGDEERQMFRLRESAGRLLESFRGLSDWDTHSSYMLDAIERVYDRNGWDSEPDQFSLTLIREVNKVPPWFMQERFDKLVEVVSDRYLLDADQELKLRTSLIRESNEMFRLHSSRIMQYAVEAIQTRAAGEAFTAEQVARWVKLAEPVFQDSRTRINALAARFKADLDPDQQALMQEDLDAANHRMADIEEMGQHWEQGEWEPSDWGLEEDPIQLAGEERAIAKADAEATSDTGRQPTAGDEQPVPPDAQGPPRPGPGPQADDGSRTVVVGPTSPAPPVVVRGPAGPRDAWAIYVERFIQKYRLDESQQSRAWKIYRDVKRRGDRYRGRYGQQLETARRRVKSPEDEKAKATVRGLEAKRDAALTRLFEQMKRRLDRLPTRAQRRDAAADTPDEPAPEVKKPVNSMANDGP